MHCPSPAPNLPLTWRQVMHCPEAHKRTAWPLLVKRVEARDVGVALMVDEGSTRVESATAQDALPSLLCLFCHGVTAVPMWTGTGCATCVGRSECGGDWGVG